MSASAVPIPLDQFALALHDLEVPQLHEESARLQNSLYHLERSNSTLAEYPDDEDCKDAIIYNTGVMEQQKQRVELVRLELNRRGVNLGHAGLGSATAPAPVTSDGGENVRVTPGEDSHLTATTDTNGHAGEEEAGVYL